MPKDSVDNNSHLSPTVAIFVVSFPRVPIDLSSFSGTEGGRSSRDSRQKFPFRPKDLRCPERVRTDVALYEWTQESEQVEHRRRVCRGSVRESASEPLGLSRPRDEFSPSARGNEE